MSTPQLSWENTLEKKPPWFVPECLFAKLPTHTEQESSGYPGWGGDPHFPRQPTATVWAKGVPRQWQGTEKGSSTVIGTEGRCPAPDTCGTHPGSGLPCFYQPARSPGSRPWPFTADASGACCHLLLQSFHPWT